MARAGKHADAWPRDQAGQARRLDDVKPPWHTSTKACRQADASAPWLASQSRGRQATTNLSISFQSVNNSHAPVYSPPRPSSTLGPSSDRSAYHGMTASTSSVRSARPTRRGRLHPGGFRDGVRGVATVSPTFFRFPRPVGEDMEYPSSLRSSLPTCAPRPHVCTHPQPTHHPAKLPDARYPSTTPASIADEQTIEMHSPSATEVAVHTHLHTFTVNSSSRRPRRSQYHGRAVPT